MEQVEKTKQYNKFKILTGNRPLDKYHLTRLKKSIENSNHLNLHPIIVNKDYEVIDGQHRLEIAKQLQIDIFYIKSDAIHDEHLIECNVNQKSFEVTNFIDYFAAKEKKPEYIYLMNTIKTTGLKPKALLTLLLGAVSTNILDFLKTGKFKLPQNNEYTVLLDSYLDFMAYVKDKRIKPISMFTNHNFTRAFRWLFKTTGFDKEVFFKKLDMRWFDLKPQRSAEDWYQLLLNIYNHNSRNQSRIEPEYALDK